MFRWHRPDSVGLHFMDDGSGVLIAAGKNPLYIARQMGHYSSGFTLDTYGHLMEALPRQQVEFIDELVFPEGWEACTHI